MRERYMISVSAFKSPSVMSLILESDNHTLRGGLTKHGLHAGTGLREAETLAQTTDCLTKTDHSLYQENRDYITAICAAYK